jgi:hypothetical protein
MSRFTKPSSFEIIARMKQLTAIETDAALARYLGITRAALLQWRTRDIMPMSYCIEVAERTDASLDYVYFGIERETRQFGETINRLLLELALQRRLPGIDYRLAAQVAGDCAALVRFASTTAERSRVSVRAAALLIWLERQGGAAEDVAVEAEAVDEAVRHGLLQRVTTGTGELLVITPAGTEMAKGA